MNRRVRALVVGAVLVTAPAIASGQGRPALAPPVPRLLGPAVRTPEGRYRLDLPDGTVLLTHGVDAKAGGGGLRPGSPERAPVCAVDVHMHVLYAQVVRRPDRFARMTNRIRSAVRRMDHQLNLDAKLSGGRTADLKVRCDAAGRIQVDRFLSDGETFYDVVYAAIRAGFALPNAKYLIFVDIAEDHGCGIASMYGDDSPGRANLNNLGGMYAMAYENCWDDRTPMHEYGHTMGAVQSTAPSSTGSPHHCNEWWDVMCYVPDGGERNQYVVHACRDRIYFDCRYDTYFDAAPEPREYLADHWNIGSPDNRFVAFG